MTTVTITCISTCPITVAGVPVQNVQTKANAILPAKHTVTEMYVQSIGSTPLTANRRLRIGTALDDNQFTGSGCGVSTNRLNNNDHVALTDIGGAAPSRQRAYNDDTEFRLEGACFGSIPDGQVRLVIKMKPNPPTSNNAVLFS